MLIMNSDMATRSNAQGKKIGDRSTAFQLHKSQLILSTGKNVIDFSEYRLKMFVQKITDEQQKQTIIDIIKQYWNSCYCLEGRKTCLGSCDKRLIFCVQVKVFV